MLHYQLLLHTPASTDPAPEAILAEDDDQACSLAELRLLMTPGVAAVTVLKAGSEILSFDRDPRHGGLLPRRPGALERPGVADEPGEGA